MSTDAPLTNVTSVEATMAAKEVNYFGSRAQLFSRPVFLALPPPEPTAEPPPS